MKNKIKNTVARGFVVLFGSDAKYHKKEAEWLVDELLILFEEHIKTSRHGAVK